jgi:hypothetical protein
MPTTVNNVHPSRGREPKGQPKGPSPPYPLHLLVPPGTGCPTVAREGTFLWPGKSLVAGHGFA